MDRSIKIIYQVYNCTTGNSRYYKNKPTKSTLVKLAKEYSIDDMINLNSKILNSELLKFFEIIKIDLEDQ